MQIKIFQVLTMDSKTLSDGISNLRDSRVIIAEPRLFIGFIDEGSYNSSTMSDMPGRLSRHIRHG